MPPINFTRISRALLTSRPHFNTTIRHSPIKPHTLRPLSTTQPFQVDRNPHPQRDAQHDREKIDTEANEYSKSGTDSEAASNEEAAFDPNITDPQEEKKKAGEGNKVNPLDASPANPDISKQPKEAEGSKKKQV